jgi:hypothetical protein
MVSGESVAVQHAARESVIAAPWPTILGWTLASCAALIDASYRWSLPGTHTHVRAQDKPDVVVLGSSGTSASAATYGPGRVRS